MSSKSNNINNQSDDGDDDYMSDAFLQQPEDKKTSLLFSHKEQYQHKLFKKKTQTQQKSKKELAQLEIEKRNEALDKPISSANKGFMLLQKMMQKNKQQQNDSADDKDNKKDIKVLMEERKPIALDFKTDRKGFGHEKPATVKRKQDDDKIAVISEQDFIRSKRSKTDLFYAKKDLFSCQRSCCTLDQNNGAIEPKERWFWPPEIFPKEEKTEDDSDQEQSKSVAEVKEISEEEEEEENKKDDEEEIDYSERLRTIVEYLRQEYFYCNWCGVKYDSTDDLQQNCPGNTREDHVE